MDALQQKLKEMLVRDLKLQDLTPEGIDSNMPLFGEGLGLDSLDAVELVILVQKNFNVQISDMEEGKKAFASVAALAEFIKNRTSQA